MVFSPTLGQVHQTGHVDDCQVNSLSVSQIRDERFAPKTCVRSASDQLCLTHTRTPMHTLTHANTSCYSFPSHQLAPTNITHTYPKTYAHAHPSYTTHPKIIHCTHTRQNHRTHSQQSYTPHTRMQTHTSLISSSSFLYIFPFSWLLVILNVKVQSKAKEQTCRFIPVYVTNQSTN